MAALTVATRSPWLPLKELCRFSMRRTRWDPSPPGANNLLQGLGEVLTRRGIPHCFVGHPSMPGLFFSSEPPNDYRDWARSDYTFYKALAPNLHDAGVLVEPDSREPWFLCEAHDEACIEETVTKFEQAVHVTLEQQQGKRYGAV